MGIPALGAAFDAMSYVRGFVAVDEVGRAVRSREVRYLNPADKVLEDMFTGWRRQQLSRNLAFATIDSRERLVRRFVGYTNEMPWLWTVSHVDEFFGGLRSEHDLRRSTIRS